MSKTSKSRPKSGPQPQSQPNVPQPVDVVDGIADRSGKPFWPRLAGLLAIFAGWVALLICCKIAGTP